MSGGLKLRVADPLQAVQDALLRAGIAVNETRVIEHGHQLRGAGGESVNVFGTGSVVVQGRNQAATRTAIEVAMRAGSQAATSSAPRQSDPAPRSVANKAPEQDVEPYSSRPRPPGWTEEAWDGQTAPF